MHVDLLTFVFFITTAAFLAGVFGERLRARFARRPWSKGRSSGELLPFSKPKEDSILDAASQLRTVMDATFEKRRLLSKAEARVLYAAEKAIKVASLKWRVMAQVSLGEVLSSPDARAYSCINSKRVDLLIISSTGEPIAAIEYQGAGHFQGNAAARDAVKREALRKAGIRFIEIGPENDPEDVAREITRIGKREQPSPGDDHSLKLRPGSPFPDTSADSKPIRIQEVGRP